MPWIALDDSTLASVNVGRPSFAWKDPRNPSSGTVPIRLDEWQDSWELPCPPEHVVAVRVVRGALHLPCPRQALSGPSSGGIYFHRIEGRRLVIPFAVPEDATVEVEVE